MAKNSFVAEVTIKLNVNERLILISTNLFSG